VIWQSWFQGHAFGGNGTFKLFPLRVIRPQKAFPVAPILLILAMFPKPLTVMKSAGDRATCLLAFSAALCAFLLLPRSAHSAVLTVFTYQGSLQSNGVPITGLYDFTFALYGASVSGSQIGSTFTNSVVGVTNGLFNVPLDFGASAFNGQPRWLEISVRKDTNSSYTTLSPRQSINATPYALSAAALSAPLSSDLLPTNASRVDVTQIFSSTNIFAGPVILTNSANAIAGTFFGDATGLTNVNSSAIRRVLTTPVPLSGTNFIADFLNDAAQITATTNINFLQSTNRPAAGYYGECVWYIQGGTTNRLITFNPNWTPVGTLATNSPFLLLSNKLCLVAFSARGLAETNVVYAIARQE
jgi:hypothetical protein